MLRLRWAGDRCRWMGEGLLVFCEFVKRLWRWRCVMSRRLGGYAFRVWKGEFVGKCVFGFLD